MTRRAAFLLAALVAFPACTDLTRSAVQGAAGAALGGDAGPSLDVQAGRTNARTTLGDAAPVEQRFAPVVRDTALENLTQRSDQTTADKSVKADRVDSLTVQSDLPPWLLLAFVLGWVLDSPLRWPGQVAAWLRERKTK